MARKGEGWETELEVWHRTYDQQRRAFIHRCHPAVRQAGDKWWYEAKGPPDFVGCLSDGRHLLFDAKESKLKSGLLPFKNIEDHQAVAFERVALFPATIPFLAVRTVDGDFVVTWRSIRHSYWDWREGNEKTASVNPSVIGLKMSATSGWIDILESMSRVL